MGPPAPLVPGPWSPGPLFMPTCKSLGWENVVFPSNQVTVIVSTTKNMYTSALWYHYWFSKDMCVRPNLIMCRHCAICVDFVLTAH